MDRFYAQHGRLPGWSNEQVLPDVPLLKVLPLPLAKPSNNHDTPLQEQVGGLLKEWSLDTSLVSNDIVHEMCRFGGSELHNIAAFMGGICSLEAIKVITTQWVPIDNTTIYNGINGTTSSIKL